MASHLFYESICMAHDQETPWPDLQPQLCGLTMVNQIKCRSLLYPSSMLHYNNTLTLRFPHIFIGTSSEPLWRISLNQLKAYSGSTYLNNMEGDLLNNHQFQIFTYSSADPCCSCNFAQTLFCNHGEVRGEDLGGLLSCTITVWWKLFCPPESCWRRTIAAPGPASPVVWGPENFPPPAPLRQRVWAPPWLYQRTKWRCLCPTQLLIYRGRWGSQTLWFWGEEEEKHIRRPESVAFPSTFDQKE